MKKSHEEKSWRKVMIKSHDEKTWRLFDRKSWRMNKLFTTIYLSLCLDKLNQKFKSILDFNTLTQLKYSVQTSWLNSNTQFQNSDSNQVLMSWELDLISMIQLDVISLVKWSSCFLNMTWSSLSNDLHISLHVSLHVFLHVFLHNFSSWFFFMISLHDFSLNDLHVFSSWLFIMTFYHDFLSWLFFMTFYHIVFLFLVMTLYQKDNAKR